MNPLALDLYWNPDRGDNFVTATPQGRDDAAAAGYALVRREAYLYPSNEPGLRELKLYWSPEREDNMTAATPEAAQDAIANGYQFVRVEGYVRPEPDPGAIPLKLYYGEGRGDYFLTGTPQGEAAAQAAGYQFIRVEGYGAFEPATRTANVRSEVGSVIPSDGIMETSVTVYQTGVVEALTETINKAVFWGFQGGVMIFFSDAQGTAINGLSFKREPFGVQGTAFGFSRRLDPWTEQIDPNLVSRIQNIHIFHFLGGTNLAQELAELGAVVQQAAGVVGGVTQIVTQITQAGGKGK